jgi:hypothetical protein
LNENASLGHILAGKQAAQFRSQTFGSITAGIGYHSFQLEDQSSLLPVNVMPRLAGRPVWRPV